MAKDRKRDTDRYTERESGTVRETGEWDLEAQLSLWLCILWKEFKKRTLKVSIFHQARESVSTHTHSHTCTLAPSPPASYYKAEWRGGMAAFVPVCQIVCVRRGGLSLIRNLSDHIRDYTKLQCLSFLLFLSTYPSVRKCQSWAWVKTVTSSTNKIEHNAWWKRVKTSLDHF